MISKPTKNLVGFVILNCSCQLYGQTPKNNARSPHAAMESANFEAVSMLSLTATVMVTQGGLVSMFSFELRSSNKMGETPQNSQNLSRALLLQSCFWLLFSFLHGPKVLPGVPTLALGDRTFSTDRVVRRCLWQNAQSMSSLTPTSETIGALSVLHSKTRSSVVAALLRKMVTQMEFLLV